MLNFVTFEDSGKRRASTILLNGELLAVTKTFSYNRLPWDAETSEAAHELIDSQGRKSYAFVRYREFGKAVAVYVAGIGRTIFEAYDMSEAEETSDSRKTRAGLFSV